MTEPLASPQTIIAQSIDTFVASINSLYEEAIRGYLQDASAQILKDLNDGGYNVVPKPMYHDGIESVLTFGEIRVRTNFNPSASTVVDLIKQKTAELINLCESLKTNDIRMAEIVRLVDLAQTAYEDAAMWAVKAATV